MASLQKTYQGDLTQSIARRLWALTSSAAQDASDVRNAAEEHIIAQNLKTPDRPFDPQFRRTLKLPFGFEIKGGDYFGQALRHKLTPNPLGFFGSRFQKKPFSDVAQHPFLKGQSTPFASPVGPFKTNAQTMNRLAGQPFPWVGVGSPLKYQQSQSSATVSNTPKVPKAPGVKNTAKREKGVAVQDQKLGNFLAAVALSLSSSFNSITKKLDEASEGINFVKDGIDNTYKKLEQHSDSLESKLDDIIDALRFANIEEKVQRDQREFNTKKSEEAKATDFSNANRVLMQDMDRQEIRDMQAADLAEDDRGPIGDPWSEPNEKQLNIPELAKGGIVSGPDSGYLAVLHGDEAVIPLDNNYTQNEPSAVGKESIANMPMLPRAEMGIDNPSTMKPTFRNNLNVSTPMMSKSSDGGDGTDLAKAIELPSKMAGIVTMGIMGNVLKSSILPTGIVSHIKALSAPITEAFGVPNNITSDLTEGTEQAFAQNQKRQEVLAGGLGKKGREKGILGKIKEFLFGTGGGNISYRGGTGGSSTVYNRTGGGTGGGNIAWGKKEKKQITSKSDFGAIKRRTATTDAYMVEAGMLDPSAFENKYGISADKWLRLPDYPTNQSSLDSPVFTKTVSYENAFDYNNFDSPQYGLRTSEIAYNMSMEDEVKGILDGLSDPDSQVIMNNQTASTDSDNQIEHSAIAVRGNPLKEGTYLSPYSV